MEQDTESALISQNTTIDACPVLTEEDILILKQLREVIRSSKKDKERIIQKTVDLLTLVGFSPLQKPRIIVEEYLEYCPLDDISIDILAYRLLFAMKDPRAMSLYKKTGNEKSMLNSLE